MLDRIAQWDALWQEWLSLQTSAKKALQKGSSHFFLCARQAVCDKLTLDALTSTRLGQKDEGIYTHLQYLMDTYRQVIDLFENQITDPASDLVAGLCDILNSRLRQFEDVDSPGNPILKEKLGILEAAIIHQTRQIEDLEKVYFEGSIQQLIKDILIPSELTPWEYLQKSILDKTLPALQALYQDNLRHTLVSIDDLHARKTTSFFTDLLEREWEVLGLIIQVQVKAIETACSNAEEPLHVLSKLREAYQQTGPVVSGFRKLMQKAPPSSPSEQHISYEWLASCITPPANLELDSQPFISAFMHEAEIIFNQIRKTHMGVTLDLQKYLEDEFSLSEEVIDSFEKVEFWLATTPESAPSQNLCGTKDGGDCIIDNASFADAEVHECMENKPPEAEANECIENHPVDAEAHEYMENNPADAEAHVCMENNPTAEQSNMDCSSTMTENTDTNIGNDTNVSDENEQTPDPPAPVKAAESAAPPINREHEIITGITETLQIKIESLKESLELFKLNSAALLSDLSSAAPAATDQDLLSAANQMHAAWCAMPPQQESDFIKECTALAPFLSYGDKIVKFIGAQSAKIEKAVFRFRKETLFYEISTYEEILYYSVSRLRESDASQITSAVKILDEAFQALEALLSEKNITIIRPAPHEPFNGREHEILTAEEHEDFQKGEVIKTMTSGYKANDQVILRANVIAAK